MVYEPSFKKIENVGEGNEVYDFMKAIAANGGARTLSSDAYSFNGLEGMSGWEILTEVRERMDEKEFENVDPFLLIVLTKKVTARFVAFVEGGKFNAMDLMHVRGDRIIYWWEFSGDAKSSSVIRRRVSVEGFRALFMDEETGQMFTAIISCKSRQAYEETREMLTKATKVRIEGMHVDASHTKIDKNNYVIVQAMTPEMEDYSGATNVLAKLDDWRKMIPLRDARTGEPLLDETVQLAMMMSTAFYREKVAALNIVFFGPPRTGKTATLHYLTERIMNGSFVIATASSGKGWLVTHAKDTDSKIFTEHRLLCVDEFFKAAADIGAKSNFHSWSMSLNNFMQKHMSVLEKREAEASSGFGTIRGKMRCSFLAAENDDESLQRALARSNAVSGGPMRRLQFGYVDRKETEGDDFNILTDSSTGSRYMDSYFYRTFGKNAFKDMRSLYMYSRKFTDDPSYEVPAWWMLSMSRWLFEQVMGGSEWVPKQFRLESFTGEDVRMRDTIFDFINYHHEAMTACWVAAAVIRGWEVYDSVETLQPVFDIRQQQMAEKVVRFLFESKLRVLAPGAQELLKKDEPSTIKRT